MKRYKLMLLVLLMTPFAAFTETITIIKEEFQESYSQTVKVSGRFYLGIQFASDSEQLANDKLYIQFPSESSGELCIDISSIDGRYKAIIEHRLTTPVSGLVRVDFKSEHSKEIKDYSSIELAVLARLGKSCGESGTKSLVSSWSPNVENKNVIFLIRSDARKDIVKVPNSKKTFKCKKLKNAYKVTYDKYCELKDFDITKVSSLTFKRKNLQAVPDEFIKLAY